MIRISGLPDSVKAQICEALTIANPKYTAMRRFGGWTYDIPKHLFGFVQGIDGDILIPPGFGAQAWRLVGQAGLPRELLPDPIPFPTRSIDLTFAPPFPLRASQRRAVALAGLVRHASMVIPCRGGKTWVGIKLVCEKDVPAIILVHTRDLLNQWVEDFAEVTGHRPFVFGEKKDPTGAEPVIIATVQGLRAAKPEIRQIIADTRELLLLDEGHHAPAWTWTEVIVQLRPRWRYCMTGTPIRADGLGPLMTWYIGPVCVTVTRDELRQEGAIVDAQLVTYTSSVETEFSVGETGDYERAVTTLLSDKARVELVANAISRSLIAGRGEGRRHLVLGGLDYGRGVANLVQQQTGVVPEFVNSKLRKKHNEATIARARAGEVEILFTAKKADEGLTMPDLTDVYLITPTRSPANVEQRVSRALMPKPDKAKPRVHDFIDPGVVGTGINPRTGETYRTRTMLKQFRTRLLDVYKSVVNEGLDEAHDILRAWKDK